MQNVMTDLGVQSQTLCVQLLGLLLSGLVTLDKLFHFSVPQCYSLRNCDHYRISLVELFC